MCLIIMHSMTTKLASKNTEKQKTIDKTQGKIETKQNSKSKALHITKVLHVDEGVVYHKKYKVNHDTTTKSTS